MSQYETNYRKAIYPIDRLEKSPLPDGKDKRGTYRRYVGFPPGYDELTRIVAGLNKDVKRINQCLTLDGAKAYAAKKGPNWTAFAEDVTGPDDEPDGIDEIFVADSNGDIKVVNGWTLGKGTFPQRSVYRSLYPTRDDRKANPFPEFMKKMQALEIGPDGKPKFVEPLPDDFKGLQEVDFKPNAKRLYKQLIFDPVWEFLKGEIKKQTPDCPPMIMAQIYNHAFHEVFDIEVTEQVLGYMFKEEADTLTKKEVAAIKASSDFKDNAYDRVIDLCQPGTIDDAHQVAYNYLADWTDRYINDAQERTRSQAPPDRASGEGQPNRRRGRGGRNREYTQA